MLIKKIIGIVIVLATWSMNVLAEPIFQVKVNYSPKVNNDWDGDGIINKYDLDDDGDGILDINDDFQFSKVVGIYNPFDNGLKKEDSFVKSSKIYLDGGHINGSYELYSPESSLGLTLNNQNLDVKVSLSGYKLCWYRPNCSYPQQEHKDAEYVEISHNIDISNLTNVKKSDLLGLLEKEVNLTKIGYLGAQVYGYDSEIPEGVEYILVNIFGLQKRVIVYNLKDPEHILPNTLKYKLDAHHEMMHYFRPHDVSVYFYTDNKGLEIDVI